MAQIKSALELALERTRDIKGDKEALESKKFREEGMKIAARAQEGEADAAAALAKYSGKEREWVREGLRSVLNQAVALPSGESAIDRLRLLAPLFHALSSRPEEIDGIINELADFLGQYLGQKDQLLEAVRKQAEPKLRQKEEALYQQSGRRVRLTVESDPELSKYLSMNLDKMNAQYEQALEGIRAEIRNLLGGD